MKTTIICLLASLLLCGFDLAPQRNITGKVTDAADGSPIPGVSIVLKGSTTGAVTDANGNYSISAPSSGTLVFSFVGYVTKEVRIGKSDVVNVQLSADVQVLEEVVTIGYDVRGKRAEKEMTRRSAPAVVNAPLMMYHLPYPAPEVNTEEYEGVDENIFHGADKKPLSTFSIDVDAASYSNVRRFINNGQRPPKDAVRIEEMINYFDYDYEEPKDRHPFAVHTEVSPAPWNEKHQLVHIGLQGKRIPAEDLPASNLVFLIDVSGSMNQPNKLPLVKRSFEILVDQLRAEDRVAIVVYAGAAGVVLEPTRGDEKGKILAAIEKLQSGGSTAGGAGLRLAYALAKQHFNEKGNNRVILATDGDFNVGESSNDAMEDLIEEKRKDGICLTVLGYGMGNIKDSKMELLADKGNGNYAYIDNLNEARKVLVNEFAGTLFTIATDVKLQVEFNPARVQAYRLIGYENRRLNDEDFNNDRKDAGDLGSGHTVTALYEIVPVGVKSDFYSIDDLKYQKRSTPVAGNQADWLTIKLRYKKPGEDVSRLFEHVVSGDPLPHNKTSNDFRWSASVAAFGMALAESQYINGFDYPAMIAMAQSSRGADREGYRSEFINMMKTYQLFSEAETRR